ncbi:helix-turn-helix transcriptional regulator [Paraflavitalea sp. CAU 1676]|uniref:helix-turn-helix domain-containing protein n=1 Tax=Paraflavitalea sp. CAU 1676 TaxID=3032598 RepID=UPI0023DB8E26|nr:helix-turn-helix transcriptional regulator [Paraflavitalea sp. CAU 1676]MDF2188961.1 helix-turn-helix transcriptional regulator [Paraflavitalea sp. CAU 1676]
MVKTISSQELRTKIGHNLATIRAFRNKKQETVADETEIARTTLSKIETGQHEALTLDTLVQLCNYYGTTLAEVFDLGLTTVYNTMQPITVNSGGTANPTNLKKIEHELGTGYEVALDLLKNENAFLRAQVEKLTDSKK